MNLSNFLGKNKKIAVILIIILLLVAGFLIFFLTREEIPIKRPPLALGEEQKETLINCLKENSDLAVNVEKELVFCYTPTLDFPEIYRDLTKSIKEVLNIEIVDHFIFFFSEAIPALERGECDAIPGMSPTEQREDLAAFSEPVYQEETIAVNKDNTELLEMLNLIIAVLKRILKESPD